VHNSLEVAPQVSARLGNLSMAGNLD
jgi:hypothetical protein